MPKFSHDELAEIEDSIAKTQADHEAKRVAREEKRLAKERQQKRRAQEKLVAPILLLLTIMASLLLWQLNK